MAKVAVICAILEDPNGCQQRFNEVVMGFKGIIKGRMGIPMDEYGVSVVTITVVGELDDINSLTGKIGNIEHVHVKTSISKKEV